MENNKLIAEFMGFQETSIGWYDAEECLLFEKDNTFDTLKFDTDWNWIMKVIEKIESLDYSINMKYLSCYGGIISNKNYNSINNHIEVAYVGSIPNKYVSNPPTAQNPMYVKEFNCPKEALYNLIVRFIKWYNENNK
jgi:hypothetical protein